MSTTVEVLCKGFPTEFSTYINYCRGLKFEQKPDYQHLRKLFKDLFIKEQYQNDYVFDWTIKRIQESIMTNPKISNNTSTNNNNNTTIDDQVIVIDKVEDVILEKVEDSKMEEIKVDIKEKKKMMM